MTIPTTLRALGEGAEARARCGEFYKLCRLLTRANGNVPYARQLAEATRATPRLVGVLKAAITGGNIGDWSAIADYQNIVAAFSESLRTVSVFDAMLADMVPA